MAEPTHKEDDAAAVGLAQEYYNLSGVIKRRHENLRNEEATVAIAEKSLSIAKSAREAVAREIDSLVVKRTNIELAYKSLVGKSIRNACGFL